MVVDLGALKRGSLEVSDAYLGRDVQYAVRYQVVHLSAFCLMLSTFIFDFTRNVFMNG